MFCKKCGHEINENDKFCPNCGEPVTPPDIDNLGEYRVYGQEDYDYQNNHNNNQYNNDTGSVWWGFLGLFIPLAGIILYFSWRKRKPRTAKILLIGSIIGFVLNLLTNFYFLDLIDQAEIPEVPQDPGVIPNAPNNGGLF